MYFPAEWSPHVSTWLAWPHNRETWPGKFEPIPGVFAGMIQAIARFEPVNVLCGGTNADGRARADQARELLGDLANVILHDDIPTNDAWTRDHGPMFVVGPPGTPPQLIAWGYNAWGGKYPPYDDDNRVPERIAGKLGMQAIKPGIVFEGGAIDTNGTGVMLAGESCVLDPRRNQDLTKSAAEHMLATYCGARQVVWLTGEIAGDDTDGHADQVARFVNDRTILAAVEDDPAEENFAPLQENVRILRQTRDSSGQPFEIVALPMPRPIYFQGQRLPASYANFYIINGAVIIPQFDDPADADAAKRIASYFPDREPVLLPSQDLVLGLGGVHCATQPQFAQQ